jgi:hypothetical protein
MADPSPYPDLQVQPNSGLDFPWAFETGPMGNVSDASFGPEGVSACEFMFIYDADTEEALPQILGFSSRNTDTNPPTLQRQLPMRHPYYNQMFATRIVKVDGIGPTERYDSPTGPYQLYQILRLTIQFSRPPYVLLKDNQIPTDPDTGVPQEWLRFTTYQWVPNVEILARQGTQFQYSTSGTAPYQQQFGESLGLPVSKLKLTLTWHQIPQLALYNANYFPINVIFDYASPGSLLLGAVNNVEFFGCAIGTLLYLGPEIIPKPLQLPPDLMDLDVDETFFLQYDIRFHFAYFDPPIGPSETVHGWNTAPWADTFWYAVQSVQGGNPPFTPGQMQSLFQIA